MTDGFKSIFRHQPSFSTISDSEGRNQDYIFIKDYTIDCNIGVYAEEKGVTQKVRLSVDAYLETGVRSTKDEMIEVPSYTDILDAIEKIQKKGHVNLVETFAEQIALLLLVDKRINGVRVIVEKLERGPVRGVQIYRTRSR